MTQHRCHAGHLLQPELNTIFQEQKEYNWRLCRKLTWGLFIMAPWAQATLPTTTKKAHSLCP